MPGDGQQQTARAKTERMAEPDHDGAVSKPEPAGGRAEIAAACRELHAATLDQIATARDRLARRRDHRAPPARGERALARIEELLRRPLRAAVVGEFNTGKSSLCNRLWGIDGLPTAALANTSVPTRIHRAGEPEIHLLDRKGQRTRFAPGDAADLAALRRIDVGLPGGRIDGLDLLDFPGLGDPRFHRTIAQCLHHRFDCVVWCTAATQAWKETERASWSSLPERLRRRTVVAITHGDLVATNDDAALLTERVRFEILEDVAAIVLVSALPDRDPEAAGLAALEAALAALSADLLLERTRRASLASARIVARMLSKP